MTDATDNAGAGPPPRQVLAYAPPAAGGADAASPVWLRLLFLLTAGVAAATFFLPFTYATSPLDVLADMRDRSGSLNLALVAFPFVAGVAMAVLALRRLILPRRSLAFSGRVACLAIAGACAAATLFVTARVFMFEGMFEPEMLNMLVGPAIVVGGVALMSWLTWRGRPGDAAVAAVQLAYAANGAMCLLIFGYSDYPGWRLTCVAIAGVLAEQVLMIVRVARAPRPRNA
jgi:hypothetical protein